MTENTEYHVHVFRCTVAGEWTTWIVPTDTPEDNFPTSPCVTLAKDFDAGYTINAHFIQGKPDNNEKLNDCLVMVIVQLQLVRLQEKIKLHGPPDVIMPIYMEDIERKMKAGEDMSTYLEDLIKAAEDIDSHDGVYKVHWRQENTCGAALATGRFPADVINFYTTR